MTQLTIPLEAQPSFAAEDYVLSTCNQVAHDALLLWPNWPDYGYWLSGPPRSGKSHLASLWADKSAALPAQLDESDLQHRGCFLLDPVPDLTQEAAANALFHLLNHVKQSGGHLLLVSETTPAQSQCPLPDLASRIKALPAAAISAPDDTLLRAVWFKAFADKQLQVQPAVIDYLCAHGDRSFAAIHDAAALLDRAALTQQRAITIPLIKSLLQL